MDKKYLLGIDIGTASLKVALLDQDAQLVALESEAYGILRPAPAYAEIDTLDFWNALISSLRNLFAHSGLNASQISGIGISCLCPGPTAFDKDRNVLFNPIIYSDQRSTEEAEFIKDEVKIDTLSEITANTAMAGAISATSCFG